MARRIASIIRATAIGVVSVAAAAYLYAAPAHAGVGESDVPATSIVPEGSPSAGSPSAAPAAAGAASEPSAAPSPKPKAKTVKTRKTAAVSETEVEPANARAKLKIDTWAYAEPSKSSKHIERVHGGKFVIVTGSTRYYLRIRLKSGKTAYIEESTVDLVKPTDKIFSLTSNAAVLDKPNRWGKKLSEVHKGHEVHVVGVALNYVRIKMKSGLEGFIPMTALQ